MEDYGAAIRLAPGNAMAHYSRGASRAQLGDLAGAVSDCDDALRLAPGDAVARYSGGASRAQLGDLAGAVSDFDVAALLAPDNPDLLVQPRVDPCRDGRVPAGAGGPGPGHRAWNPAWPRPTTTGGLVYRDLGELEKAMARLRRRRRAGTELRPGPLRPWDHQSQPGRVPGGAAGLRCRHRS